MLLSHIKHLTTILIVYLVLARKPKTLFGPNFRMRPVIQMYSLVTGMRIWKDFGIIVDLFGIVRLWGMGKIWRDIKEKDVNILLKFS